MSRTDALQGPVRTVHGYLYVYEGHRVLISKHQSGVAYARNGNAHNPTKYYRWQATVDGITVTASDLTRQSALDLALDFIDGGEAK